MFAPMGYPLGSVCCAKISKYAELSRRMAPTLSNTPHLWLYALNTIP